MLDVYISLGTNLGDRIKNLQSAIAALPPKVRLVAKSPTYQTKPWGYTNQPDFLNQVIYTKTTLTPFELLVYLKEIENQIGRKPSFRYGPRVIDLDILFYEDQIIEQPNLIIPHPRLHERAFVLLPLADLAPDLKHPLLSITVSDLLAEVGRNGIEIYSD